MSDIEVINEQPSAVAVPRATGSTPGDLLLYVMQSGGSVAEVREFMQLKREYEADEARKAYVDAMAQFKLNPPTILKDKAVGYKNKDGTFTGYKHATLGNVTNAIVEGLAAHGFSHSWDVKQISGMAHVTCKITHRLGHFETVSMEAARDDSGKKNAIQQIASAITYLQRYTLLLAAGLAVMEDDGDDDARAAELDTSLADEWIAKVQAAPTDADVLKVWEMGAPKLEKRQRDFDDFEKAVLERRTALAGGAA